MQKGPLMDQTHCIWANAR